MKIVILLTMIFFHIIDDFVLQGVLAKMKQKSYWKEYVDKNSHYRYDYIVALLAHSFEWAFMILIPVFIYWSKSEMNYFNENLIQILIVMFLNTIIHAFVDNLKANELIINLIEDQMIHLIQIFVTWFVLIMVYT